MDRLSSMGGGADESDILLRRSQYCTWIVSTDPNTNAIQWRHLPLHLYCMQSQIPHSLVETLIRVYPEATEMQDHEGRTQFVGPHAAEDGNHAHAD
jgi:hypothetical protein